MQAANEERSDGDDKSDITVKIKQLMSAICMSQCHVASVSGLCLARSCHPWPPIGWCHNWALTRHTDIQGVMSGVFYIFTNTPVLSSYQARKKERIIIEQGIKSMISKYSKKEKSRYLIARAECVLCSRARAYLTIHGSYLNLNRHL